MRIFIEIMIQDFTRTFLHENLLVKEIEATDFTKLKNETSVTIENYLGSNDAIQNLILLCLDHLHKRLLTDGIAAKITLKNSKAPFFTRIESENGIAPELVRQYISYDKVMTTKTKFLCVIKDLFQ